MLLVGNFQKIAWMTKTIFICEYLTASWSSFCLAMFDRFGYVSYTSPHYIRNLSSLAVSSRRSRSRLFKKWFIENCWNGCSQNIWVVSFIAAKLKVQKKALGLLRDVFRFENLYNKQKERLSCVASTYLFSAFDCMFSSCHVRQYIGRFG